MKLGVITDIHGNIAALDAMLAEFSRRRVDEILCLGDMIGIGPFPAEAVKRIMGLKNLRGCVRGNHEGYLLDGLPESMGGEERAFHLWEHARIGSSERAFLAALPSSLSFSLDGVHVWAGHYPMPGLAASHAEAAAACPDAQVCLYGHDHSRGVTVSDGRICADFGALGCPSKLRDIARAGIVHIENGAARAEPIDVRYDVSATLRAINDFNYPAKSTILRIFYGL